LDAGTTRWATASSLELSLRAGALGRRQRDLEPHTVLDPQEGDRRAERQTVLGIRDDERAAVRGGGREPAQARACRCVDEQHVGAGGRLARTQCPHDERAAGRRASACDRRQLGDHVGRLDHPDHHRLVGRREGAIGPLDVLDEPVDEGRLDPALARALAVLRAGRLRPPQHREHQRHQADADRPSHRRAQRRVVQGSSRLAHRSREEGIGKPLHGATRLPAAIIAYTSGPEPPRSTTAGSGEPTSETTGPRAER
jgi:hypothetical protein